ncbi:MAG TPA: GtrA family protein [Anaerolineaceae bacterium]
MQSKRNILVETHKRSWTFFRYLCASVATAVVDYAVFLVVYPLTNGLEVSIAAARVASVIVQYTLVRGPVFHSSQRVKITFPRYVLLVILSGTLSTLLIQAITHLTSAPVVMAKMAAEGFLYLINYLVQKILIFKK